MQMVAGLKRLHVESVFCPASMAFAAGYSTYSHFYYHRWTSFYTEKYFIH